MKILLGKTRPDFDPCAAEYLRIEKHSWDCDWYWGFGYIGNSNLHTHFDGVFLGIETDINKIFEATKITQRDWWILRDLFVQAYALKNAAAVYRHGGHQISDPYDTTVIRNQDKESGLNCDLSIVLDKIWEILTEINTGNRKAPPAFRPKITVKTYKCQHCENLSVHSTNHYGAIHPKCKNCSWKRPMDTTTLDCLEVEPCRGSTRDGSRCTRLDAPHKWHLCYQHQQK